MDLAALLGAHGWRGTPGHDGERVRDLSGPAGERVVVSPPDAREPHWRWCRRRDGRGGAILEACQQLLGLSEGQALGLIRVALDDPPAWLPVAGGGRGAPAATTGTLPAQVAAANAASVVWVMGPERVAQTAVARAAPTRPLGPRGRDYLTRRRHLAPETVDAFARLLRENGSGGVRAPHGTGEAQGEECGEGGESFVGQGRDLWLGQPAGQDVPEQIIVADGFLDAMSAWECSPAELRPTQAAVSTGGKPSRAGGELLAAILTRMVEVHGERIVPTLFDGSDVGEADEERRGAWLRALAEVAGVEYRRYPPPVGKGWNEFLARVKDQEPVQETSDNPPPPGADPTSGHAALFGQVVAGTWGTAQEAVEETDEEVDEPEEIPRRRGPRR